MKKYIILELIPTSSNPENGEIIQLSALKLNDINLIDRFDYRITENKIPLKDLKEMVSYDKENFIYKDLTSDIFLDFKKWIEDYTLLIIDNEYTMKYLSKIENKKQSIFKHLNMEYSDDIIEKVILKYNLKPSNYIVDLLFEALIYEKTHI